MTVRVRAAAAASACRAAALATGAVLLASSGGVRAQTSDLDARVTMLVQSVSEERLTAILKKLESFGTRNTLSSADKPDRGIGGARQWIFDEMKSYSPTLQVSFDTYQLAKQGRITRDVEVRNVMAVIPGKSPRRIYVSGHYDSIARPGGQSSSHCGGIDIPRSRCAHAAACKSECATRQSGAGGQ